MPRMRTSTAFGVDIGGSGIKGAVVDLETLCRARRVVVVVGLARRSHRA